MEFIISQILAAISLILFMISYFVKAKYKFLFIQLIATAINATSYIVLGAFIGGAVSYVSFFRTACLFVLEKRNFRCPALFLPCFIALYSVPSFLLYGSWIDLLAWFAPILSTIALLFKNLKTTKTIIIFSLLMFAVYTIIVGNWLSAIELLVETVVIIVSLILQEIKNKREKTKERLS